jgi:hypothetical protein
VRVSRRQHLVRHRRAHGERRAWISHRERHDHVRIPAQRHLHFNSLADYTARQAVPVPAVRRQRRVDARIAQLAFYAQDEWRVRPA